MLIVDQWIVSVGWLETLPNPYCGSIVTKNDGTILWAQTDRPVDFHFGRVFAFDSEADARSFAIMTGNDNPQWLPHGAHDLQLSPPLRQRRPAEESAKRRYVS